MCSCTRLFCIVVMTLCGSLVAGAAAEAVRLLMTDGTVLDAELVEEGGDYLQVRLADGSDRKVSFSEIKRVLKPGEDPAAEDGGSKPTEPAPGGEEPDSPPDAPNEEEAKPADPGAPADPDAPPTKPDRPYDPAVLEGPVSIDITESIYKYCPTCDGHKSRDCWYCVKGAISYEDGTSEPCVKCGGKGVVRCETCRGSGKMPDLFKVVPCRGCQVAMDFSLAPGHWACPLCKGGGLMRVANEGKDRKCALCSGACSFLCMVCSGSALAPRIFPATNRNAEAWRDRCKKGLETLDACKLEGADTATPGALTSAAQSMPALAGMATVLQGHMDTIEKLQKQNLAGTKEHGESLRGIAAHALSLQLSQERALLQVELGFLKPGR